MSSSGLGQRAKADQVMWVVRFSRPGLPWPAGPAYDQTQCRADEESKS